MGQALTLSDPLRVILHGGALPVAWQGQLHGDMGLECASFYALLDKRLAASGYAVVQTTSPLVARQSFWTVAQTIESVGLRTAPYHAHVPSFGEWGFIIASRRPWRLPDALPGGLRFLSPATLPLMFDFPLDMARVPAEVNRLSNQALVHTYEREWGKH